MKTNFSLSIALIVCYISAVAIRTSLSQQDLTVVPGARGTDVTTAAIDRIRISGAFTRSDNRLLSRVAYVESRDGVDINTYRAGYNGGIWQVDEAIFNKTLDTTTHPELIGIYARILSVLGVDWAAAEWEDLRRPFFSALAARIFFEIVGVPIPRTGDIAGQAQFWKRHYNTDPADTVEDFVSAVNELELEGCPVRGIDLAFVFDSSGSVGIQNFEREKEYAVNVVEQFTIGPLNTQIAAIAYSGIARISFFLNTFDNQTEIATALRDIEFFDIPGRGRPSTNTAEALERLRSEVFTQDGGERGDTLGIPRVAVVLTDGRSNVNASFTIPNAQALHADGVTVFAVGVGSRVSQAEIDGIASGPEFVISLLNFDVTEFVGLERTISAEACIVPAPIDIEQEIETTIEGGRISFFQFQIPTQGMTVRLQPQRGRVVLYTSTKTRNPNSAFHDQRIEGEGAVFIDPAEISENPSRIMSKRLASDEMATEASVNFNFTNTTLYVSIQGEERENSFILDTTFGNTSAGTRLHVALGLCLFTFLLTVKDFVL